LPNKNTGDCTTCSARLKRRRKVHAAATSLRPAAHLDPARTTSSIGEASCFSTDYEPAIEVFQEATRRYPALPADDRPGNDSGPCARKYDEARSRPLLAMLTWTADARCYLCSLRPMNSVSPWVRLSRSSRVPSYAELNPTNRAGQYYYALSLWKGKRWGDASLDLQAVEFHC